MDRLRFFIVFAIIFGIASSQPEKEKVLTPTLGAPNNYSKADEKRWNETLRLYRRIEDGTLKYESLGKQEQARIDSLEEGTGRWTQGIGCSWYCGGEMYKVTATSQPATDGLSYKADNIHDFDLFTAWVPDTAKGPIGKKISFQFKPLTARVNEITIFNGYIKNYELFRRNARVKTFKLYINGVYYATLALDDTTASQTFSIEPVRSNVKNQDLVLTFEIAAVYPGDRYTEVAVSEINFNGLDVH